MTKQFKSVSMMLFLLAMSAGPAVAATGSAPIEAPVVQQSETCTGVVNDAMGPVIGASVVVKGIVVVFSLPQSVIPLSRQL